MFNPTKVRMHLYIIALMVLAFAIRVHGLGKLSLWLDEGITSYKMGFTCRELFTYTEVDNVPPLYYAILHLFRAWIHTDTALRFPSVIYGTLTLPVLFFICRRLFDVRTALLSGFLFSLSTFHVWFSQEARSYSLYTLCYALTLFFLVRWDQDPKSLKDLSGYLVCSVLMLYCHSTALFYWVTNQVIFIWLQKHYNQRKVWTWVLGQGAVLLMFVPWVPSFVSQARNFNHAINLGALDYSAVIEVLLILTSFLPLYPHEVSRILGLSIDPVDLLNLTWVVAFLGAVCLSLIRLDRKWVRSYGTALLLVTFPLLSVTFFSVSICNIFFDRLFLPSTLG
ncbi:MAG TPA: glycosyltransferase family 39 protein, partial [Terriglobia bacterium]|nr:glycosyltransferase family 39 protein [Terriglobia bacterium]